MLLNDNVAEVDPNAGGDALVLGRFGIAFGHAALDLNTAARGIDNAWKFIEQAVSGVLYGMASVLLDLRLDQFPNVGLEPLVRPLFIRSRKARGPCHVGGAV